MYYGFFFWLVKIEQIKVFRGDFCIFFFFEIQFVVGNSYLWGYDIVACLTDCLGWIILRLKLNWEVKESIIIVVIINWDIEFID